MIKDARFYFANFGVDVGRMVSAVEKGDREAYALCVEMMHRTLAYLRNAGDPIMYEKGLQLLRDFEHAREDNALGKFSDDLNDLIAEYSPLAQ
ncbi:hypothetical protein HY968_01110 [Candidatus Kaiserbacteria bacterium]|nr:hypothetical protein [Candidatus Kaiserbacteria bacterium]